MEYENQGQVMHLTLHDCTVVNRGTIMHLDGSGNQIENRGTIMHNEGGRVIYRDRVVYKDRIKYIDRYVNNPDLTNKLERLQRENEKLREALKEERLKNPCDDVLVMRIDDLQRKLNAEKQARMKDVEDLKERISVAMEINAKLRRHNEEVDKRDRDIAENHIDILATMMALYPFAVDDDIVFEFGIPKEKIRWVAQTFGLIKSKEARQEAREYLRKQGLDLIERRGGDQSKGKRKAKTKKK